MCTDTWCRSESSLHLPKPPNVTTSTPPSAAADSREYVGENHESPVSVNVPPSEWFVYSNRAPASVGSSGSEYRYENSFPIDDRRRSSPPSRMPRGFVPPDIARVRTNGSSRDSR